MVAHHNGVVGVEGSNPFAPTIQYFPTLKTLMSDSATVFAAIVTAIATTALVITGYYQVQILCTQRRQTELELIEKYHQRWVKADKAFKVVIYIGRDENAYYHITDQKHFRELIEKDKKAHRFIQVLDASKYIFELLNDLCLKVLQKQLSIQDIYSIFGTTLLRHSCPLKVLLDYTDTNPERSNKTDPTHYEARKEVQEWLVYHDGVRRRSLILIDLLWAEAARLEDLPPSDLAKAAEKKQVTGRINRKRLYDECNRLKLPKTQRIRFTSFLRHAEYKKWYCYKGLTKARLKELDHEWNARLLKNKLG